MTLDRLRPAVSRVLEPFVGAADRLGLTPDAVSALAFLLALAAAGAFALAGGANGPKGGGPNWWYLAGALLVFGNGWLDLLDGALAREQQVESAGGDLLDHVLDRYADIAVVAGLAAGVGRFDLGFLAVTGVLMTSYLGTQSQAVGLERLYAGVLGRADRLVLVGLVGLLATVRPAVAGVGLVAALLVVFAVVGHLTAVQRFVGAWRALARRSD